MPTRTDYDSAGNVSLAKEEDIPELTALFWEAFAGPAESVFPQNESGRVWLERSFRNFLGKPSYYRPETKVPVVRNVNGRVASFAIVHVVKQGQTVVGSSWKRRWSRADDIPRGKKGQEGVSEERLAGYFEPMARAHHLVVGKEGHVFIELVITKKNQRNKGNASALVAWATKLADDMDVPCYLDGGGRGATICARNGFAPQDVERRYGGPPPCVPMLRPKKSGA